MVKSKQKIGFFVKVVNANKKVNDVGLKTTAKCRLRIVSWSLESSGQINDTTSKWRNYFCFTSNERYTIYPEKLKQGVNLVCEVYSHKSGVYKKVGDVDFTLSNAPQPIEIPFNLSDYSNSEEQEFYIYLRATTPVEDLIVTSEKTPVGNFTINMKVQLVDDSGEYSDSDVVTITSTFASGIVQEKPLQNILN